MPACEAPILAVSQNKPDKEVSSVANMVRTYKFQMTVMGLFVVIAMAFSAQLSAEAPKLSGAAIKTASCPDASKALPFENINVEATKLALSDSSNQDEIGDIVYRGGLVLKSEDARFGGLSGLEVTSENELIAVSDQGYWFLARLRWGEEGLSGLDKARIGFLRDHEGKILDGKKSSDGEGIAALNEGLFAVSFERHHRLLYYDLSACKAAARGISSGEFLNLPEIKSNGGMEAITQLDDVMLGGLETKIEGDTLMPVAAPFDDFDVSSETPRFKGRPGYNLTGLDGANGHLFVLMRAYNPALGARAMIYHIPPGSDIHLKNIAHIRRPLNVDNFEGISVLPLSEGGYRIFIISDDNYSARQRSLLMVFDYLPEKEAEM